MSTIYEFVGVDAETGRDVYVEYPDRPAARRPQTRTLSEERPPPAAGRKQLLPGALNELYQRPEHAGRELTLARSEPGRDYEPAYYAERRSYDGGYDRRGRDGGYYERQMSYRRSRSRSRSYTRTEDYDKTLTRQRSEYDVAYQRAYEQALRRRHTSESDSYYDSDDPDAHYARRQPHPRRRDPRYDNAGHNSRAPSPSPSGHNNLKTTSPGRHSQRKQKLQNQHAQTEDRAQQARKTDDRGRTWYSMKPRSEAHWWERHFDSSYDGLIAAAAGGAIGAITARTYTGGVRNGEIKGQRDAYGEVEGGKWDRDGERGRGVEGRRGDGMRGESSGGLGKGARKTDEVELTEKERWEGRKEGWKRGVKMAVGGVVGAAAANYAENKISTYNETRGVQPEERWCGVVQGLG